jgi:hypothetical protein
MIDGVKIEARGDTPQLLLNDPKLEFKSRLIEKTGEIIKDYQWVGSNGFKIEIRKGVVTFITGSLHKFMHGENSGDFTLKSLSEAIDRLCTIFHLDADESYIRNIEIGYNLLLPFSATEFIKRNVVNFKGVPPTSIEQFDGKGYQINFKKTKYVLKLYDKGRQVRSDDNILRIEVRVKAMSQIKGAVKTLVDLKNKDKLFKLTQLIDDSLKNLLIIDSIDVNRIQNDADKELFLLGINPSYWERTRPKAKDFKDGENDKEYIRKKNRYYKIKKWFFELLERNNLLKTKKIIEILVEHKKKELFGYSSEYDAVSKKLFSHLSIRQKSSNEN